MDLSGGAVSSGGSPVNAGNAQAAGPAPTSSGNFTNFNKYLEMNQPQAEGLGQKVASGIQNKTNQANEALQTGQNEFNQKLSAATPALTPEQLKEAAKDPAKFVQDPDNISKFASTYAGEYGGPGAFSDVSNYQDLIAAVQKAAQSAEQVKTTGGREELIKDIYQKPERAKAGMLGLDEALLKGTSGAITPVQEQAKEAGKIGDRASEIEASAGKAVEQKKADVSGAAKEAYEDFLGDAGAYNRLKEGVEGKLASVTKEATAASDEAKKWLDPAYAYKMAYVPYVPAEKSPTGYPIFAHFDPSKITISDTALKNLGITKTQFVDLLNKRFFPAPSGTAVDPAWQNVDFRNYAQFGTPASAGITLSNVASEEDYKTLDALSQLLGDEINSEYINTPDKAGSYNPDLVNFDYKALLDYLSHPVYLPLSVTNG